MMRFQRYIRSFVLWLLALLLLVFSINWIVDPYAMYGSAFIPGFNQYKPFAGNRGRLSKVHQALAVKPAAVVVGNSRPEMGIDPLHRCWPAESRPVFNMGIPGFSISSQIHYARHAMAAGKPEMIVMGLDFLDFLEREGSSMPSPSWPPADSNAQRLLVDANGVLRSQFKYERMVDVVTSLASLSTFSDSLKTLFQQHGEAPGTQTEFGFNQADGLYNRIVRREGVGVLFAQKNREVMRKLHREKWTLYQRRQAGHAQDAEKPMTIDGWSMNYEALQRLLLAAVEQDVTVVLFINPYHAEYLVSISLAGLWPLLEQWKRDVLQIAQASSVPVWDFNDFDGYSTESYVDLPKRGRSLQWFWEPAHYKKELGDIMLANMLSTSCGTGPSVPAYGVLLTQDQLESHLRALGEARDAYLASQPNVVKRLRALAEASR